MCARIKKLFARIFDIFNQMDRPQLPKAMFYRICAKKNHQKNLYTLQYFFYVCNVFVQRTRPNAVDRLGCTTYRATLRVDLIHLVSLLLVATLELTLHHPPPFTLATALHRFQPAQGRASTTPTSCRARHCNVFVKRTPPNAVDRLG